jgi:peptide chain release factor subunit 1
MLTRTDLQTLSEFRKANGKVLSVYLDIDQSKATNLNRGFERALQTELRSVENTLESGDERVAFGAAALSILEIIGEHRPRTRAVILFARSGCPVWMKEIDVQIPTEVRWGDEAYIPLFIEALDEFERYAVVLVDKGRARIFTIALGAIHEEANVINGAPTADRDVDHIETRDQIRKRADAHSLRYFKRVAKILEIVNRNRPFERVVLSGTPEAKSALCRSMSKATRSKIMASMALPVRAPAREVLEQTLAAARKAERLFELTRTESLITAAAKGERAITGPEETVDALKSRRVRELIYAEGLRRDLVESAILSALEEGASIEQVRGDAAERLKAIGGMGAFLRF